MNYKTFCHWKSMERISRGTCDMPSSCYLIFEASEKHPEVTIVWLDELGSVFFVCFWSNFWGRVSCKNSNVEMEKNLNVFKPPENLHQLRLVGSWKIPWFQGRGFMKIQGAWPLGFFFLNRYVSEFPGNDKIPPGPFSGDRKFRGFFFSWFLGHELMVSFRVLIHRFVSGWPRWYPDFEWFWYMVTFWMADYM